jgi:uncharacterized membrane protein
MSGPGRPGFRRRLDTFSLRVQARLDADWADQSLPWLFAAALFVVLLAMSLALVRQLDGGPGLAQWTQAAWHVRRGQPPVTSLTGTNLVESQWAFVAVPVLWASRWIPTPQLLAGVQALALALAVVPLWRLARTVFDLRIGTTSAVIGAFALAPAVHAANLSLFHPELLALPALAGAALWRRQERWLRYWLCIGVILASRADLGLTVAAVGAVAILDGQVRAGVVSVVLGLGWTVAAIVVLDPEVPTGELTSAQAFAAAGTAPLAQARDLLTDPTSVLGDVFAQGSLPILVALLAPLLFLSLSSPRTLIPAVPPLVLGIAAGQVVQEASEPGVPEVAFGAALAVVAVVPITIAGLSAISRIGRRSITRINVDHRIVASIVVASMILFVQNAPSSPYQQPWDWGGRDQVDAARQEAIDGVGPDEPLTVSPQLAAEVAERRLLLETPLGPPASGTFWSPLTDVVLLDTTAEGSDGTPLWEDADREEVLGSLADQGFGIAYEANGIYRLVRSEAG